MTFMLTNMQHRHEVQALRVSHLLKGLRQNVGTPLASFRITCVASKLQQRSPKETCDQPRLRLCKQTTKA